MFAVWLRGQAWLDPTVFFVTVIVAVIGSLVLDSVAVARTRVPYVSDVELPGESVLGAPARPVGVSLRAVLGPLLVW